ncbi:MAG: response regulator [Xanthomonadales bacterium]|nr:response regulator [Xanthomonadales bacterium]
MAYRILIADDNRINREFLVGVLAGEEYQIEQAMEGSAAIELCRRNRFDLVLMDIRMPGVDGIEATRAIRSLPGLQDLPIVALTADVALQRDAIKDEAFAATLVKPVSRRELLETLNRLLGATPAGIELQENPIAMDAALAAAGGNRELVGRLTAMLRKELDDFEPKISAAIDRADWPAARELVHKLRASAGYCGARPLATAAGTLEEALDKGEGGTIRDLQARLKREMAILRTHLDESTG